MTERLKQAEQDVVQARSELAADVDDLLNWFDGVTPLMGFLNEAARFRNFADTDDEDFERDDSRATGENAGRQSFWSKVTDTIGSNTLPVLLITFGIGLLLQGNEQRRRGKRQARSDSRFRRRSYSRSDRRRAR